MSECPFTSRQPLFYTENCMDYFIFSWRSIITDVFVGMNEIELFWIGGVLWEKNRLFVLLLLLTSRRLMTVVITLMLVRILNNHWSLDSIRLPKCMKNNGCEETDVLDTVLTTLLTNGQLIISSDADCSKINQKWWKSIEIGENLCNTLTSLNMVDYVNLESLQVGSNSLTAVTSLTISNAKNFKSLTVGENGFKSVATLNIYSTKLSKSWWL